MESRLIRHAAAWTVLGLLSGLFYREFTRFNGHEGGTQLALVHTHILTLGTLSLLVVALLVRVFKFQNEKGARFFLPVWTVGLVLAVGAMVTKGVLQVLGNPAANSAAISGVSGLGHITLTVGFVLLFLPLLRATSKAVPAE